jgi:hypothetical protein
VKLQTATHSKRLIYLIILSDFNEALVFSKDINDGQMDRHEATGRFSQVCEGD